MWFDLAQGRPLSSMELRTRSQTELLPSSPMQRIGDLVTEVALNVTLRLITIVLKALMLEILYSPFPLSGHIVSLLNCFHLRCFY